MEIKKVSADKKTESNETMISMIGLEELVKEQNRKEKIQMRISKLIAERDDLDRRRAFASPQQAMPIVDKLHTLEIELVDLRASLDTPDVSPGMTI